MLTTLATLAALTLAYQGESDTTVAVQAGARLDVNNFGGEIAVRTWSQNSVRVRASHSARDHVDVSASPTAVSVRTSGRRGPSSIVELQITAPTWMAVTLSGVYTDITVEGAGGDVTAESVQGDVSVTGGNGNISLKSVEGSVTLSKTRGRIEITTVEGDVTVSDAVGEISAESVDGDLRLLHIEASSVDVNTVDGNITYDGTIRDGGRYRLSTHDGDVAVAVPLNANVVVSVATFDGEFDASFPVNLTRAGKRRFSFTIGGGSARLELETFDGNIRLRRPGQLTEPTQPEHKPKHDKPY
jgi:hypothetical protein